MGHINEPVKSCKIIFKYKSWAPDQRSKIFYQDTFQSVPELREYFIKFPAYASGVGYGKTPAGSIPPSECVLVLEWTDQAMFASKEFPTAKLFADFLKEHTPPGRFLQFQP